MGLAELAPCRPAALRTEPVDPPRRALQEHRMRHRSAGTVIVGGAAFACVLLGRRRQIRWGATDRELDEPLAGDELILNPNLTSTRAITIGASVDRVWPWIAQLGQGRGGFYSYDLLENLVGCDIHSADRIVPEWQDVQVGDKINLHPDVALEVANVVPERSLVMCGGVPMGNAAPPYDFTWAFVLRDGPDRTTRLVVRERYGYTRWWAGVLVEAVEAASFVMSQKMLRGIRDRVELTATVT
jgi:hypothetical protein